MAKFNIKYNCGCGYITNSFAEAVKHVDAKKHTLTVLGIIKPENNKKEE